ncbi:MAG TPA: HAMP domain-containing sensor histidine kinase [Chryseolinea sp.]|nr:HAMP domain-containing sensor histidine kinase [Chryseolinea sp.]
MRLLNRTVRSYILYSGLLLLIAIPIFYFVLSRLVRNEVDEVLLSHKKDFIKSSANFNGIEDIQHYPLLNEEFFVTPSKMVTATDSFYTEYIKRLNDSRLIPFRVVKTGIEIQGKPYELLVKESLLESEDLILTIVYTQIALISLLLLGLILIHMNLSRNLWKPFYRNLSALKLYDLEKNKEVAFEQSQIDEFEDLRQVMQQLLHKNQQVYLSQKEFTQNASHEIQTPLAAVNVKLDLLMQTENISKEQADLLLEIADSTHHVSRLTRSLLLLSKIENDQFREIERLDLVTIIQKITHGLDELALERRMTMRLSLQPFEIPADRTRMEILLSNVLNNAIQHSQLEGEIYIELREGTLRISNPGLPLHQPEKIFDRFQRDLSTSAGSGLGLALVSKICALNGYLLAYRFEGARHHFEINFITQNGQ